MQFSDIKDHLIAVDTEYQSTETLGGRTHIERMSGIRTVFCAAFCTASGGSWVTWINKDQDYSNILSRAADALGIRDPIFVNYNYRAEWEAFKRLGDSPENHRWIDAWLLYRLKINFQGSDWEAYKKAQGLVDALKDMLGICRDSEYKDYMRKLCMEDRTEGYEDEILAYCLEDAKDLIALTEALWLRLERRIKSPQVRFFTPKYRGMKRDSLWEPLSDQIFGLMDALKSFTIISHRGLPVSVERLEAVRSGAAKYCDYLVSHFVIQYPDSFTFKPVEESTKTVTRYIPESVRNGKYASLSEMLSAFKQVIETKSDRTKNTIHKQGEFLWELTKVKGISGTWHRNESKCREYLRECLHNRGITNWPKTETGMLSLDSETLKDEFDDETGCFGADYYVLSKATNCLRGIQKEGDDSWVHTLDREEHVLRYNSLRPFTARTGRCQPQASKGFVFGWYKALYCVLEPPEGKWLVELDFTAEETFIQACVFKDPRYAEIYQAKDMYLWMGVELGMIPRDEFNSKSKAELKHIYKEKRDRLKTYTLALGYGAGTQKLSAKVKLPVETVAKMQNITKTKVFPRSTAVREALKKEMTAHGYAQKRCLWLQNGWHTIIPTNTSKLSMNAPLNFPIQGMGSVILSALVVELENLHIETLATIHDAILFMVNENDYDTITLVSQTMQKVANHVLGVPDGESGMKVGDPEIIKRGKIWTPEGAYDSEAKQLLSFGGLNV